MAVDAAEILTPTIVNGLATGWSWKRLDSVCEGVFDCPHSTPLLTQDGPFIARSQDMRSGVFRTDEAAHVSDETYRERVVRAEPKHGDLLYSREGTYFGIAAEVPRGVQVCLGQRMVLLRPHANKVNFRFLRYWLNSPVMTMYAHGFRDGTVAERLNLPTIRALPVALPPLPEQRAIAHILGTLDDKIELNRRMNETLEAMARALFKSWFVDFDPVRAKAEGRDPGLPKHIADLFSDRFEDSELGEIPTGWVVNRWGSLVSLAYGKSLTGYDGESRKYPVYGTNGRIGSHSTPLCNHPGIIIGRKGAYRGVHYCSTPFYVIDTAFYVEPNIGTELRWAYYELLRQDINGMDSGSAIPSTSREDFYSLPVLSPPAGVQAAFAQFLTPSWARQELNISECRTLVAVRDTLLPKLISGELRISATEAILQTRA